MPIIRSSRVLYSGCCLWYVSGLQDAGLLQTRHITLSSTPDQLLEKPQHEIPQAATTVYTLELLMMGIVVPETC